MRRLPRGRRLALRFTSWPALRLEQARAEIRTRLSARRHREHRAAYVRRELVHHVELRELVVDRNEAGTRVALVSDENQPRVVFGFLTPWRPALDVEVRAVVVRIRAA